MSKYKVMLCRTYYAHCTIEVEAKNQKEAEKKARDAATFHGIQQGAENDEILSIEKEGYVK